jgi:hypothetical protein
LAAALDKYAPKTDGTSYCVPLCTACHKTTQGGPGNTNVFGATLERSDIGLVPGDASRVDPAIAKWAAIMPAIDSDGDGVSDIDEIMAGDSPSVAGPAGDGQFCPDTTYGCGAHIATRPPTDGLSLIPIAFVAAGLFAARRRKRKH